MYRPPNIDIDFKEYFNKIFNEILLQQLKYDSIIFVGDLNVNFAQSLNQFLDPKAKNYQIVF